MTALAANDAARRIVASAARLDAEQVALNDALGRVLAQDVTSPVDLPPWNNASMDGYAVRAEDVRGATEPHPKTLKVIGTIAAGGTGERPVQAGEAYRIMTGAPVPPGADSVVRVEDTDAGTERVEIRNDRDASHNIRPRGEDLKRGDVAITGGTRIGAAHLAVLASTGFGRVVVTKRPRVGILTTGDELVEVAEYERVLAGERIVNSNRYTMEALVRATGAEPVVLGLQRDDPAALRATLENAPPLDMLLTSGGISVGAFDHTRDVLHALGATLDFWRVSIRPGAPLAFGRWRNKPWVGLPGNPASTVVTFELFVRPALRAMLGMPRVFVQPVQVRAGERLPSAGPRTFFLRSVVSPARDGMLEARLTGPQGSGLLTSSARANALVIVPADSTEVQPGKFLRALLLDSEAMLGAEPAY